jgi:pimeloyl-ACP methyl ester carboxylesterase
MEVVADRFPGLRTAVIPGVGHFAMIEAPARVSSLLREFAGDVVGSPA